MSPESARIGGLCEECFVYAIPLIRYLTPVRQGPEATVETVHVCQSCYNALEGD